VVEEKRLNDCIEKNAIQQRMEEVRRDLDESVQNTVEGVREMSDWRSYMKAYPWAGLATAFAVGYLIVWWGPFRSKRDGEKLSEAETQSHPVEAANLPQKGKTRDLVLSFVGSFLMRGLSSYVGKQAAMLLAKQSNRSLEAAKSRENN
jgi:hypothetical protein